jgi:hypothetical protein
MQLMRAGQEVRARQAGQVVVGDHQGHRHTVIGQPLQNGQPGVRRGPGQDGEILAEPAAQVPGQGAHHARVVVDDEQGRPWQAGPAPVSGQAHRQAGCSG